MTRHSHYSTLCTEHLPVPNGNSVLINTSPDPSTLCESDHSRALVGGGHTTFVPLGLAGVPQRRVLQVHTSVRERASESRPRPAHLLHSSLSFSLLGLEDTGHRDSSAPSAPPPPARGQSPSSHMPRPGLVGTRLRVIIGQPVTLFIALLLAGAGCSQAETRLPLHLCPPETAGSSRSEHGPSPR